MTTHWTQDDLSADGVRLHYHRTGHGEKPPLVLLHGFTDNGLCWTPIARGLESEYDVIMPDMPGHGLSERMRPGKRVDMASNLAEFIRALGLNRPVVIGHSMGAMIAYQIGVRFPERAGALVLEDPPWGLSPSFHGVPPDRPEESPTAQWAKSLADLTLEELLAQNRADHPDWTESFVRIMCRSKKQFDPAITDPMVEQVLSQMTDWMDGIRQIAQPLLIFAGDPERGGIVTPEVVAKIRELNPAAAVVVVPDVGHLIRFDRPAVFLQEIRAFLRRIAA